MKLILSSTQWAFLTFAVLGTHGVLGQESAAPSSPTNPPVTANPTLAPTFMPVTANPTVAPTPMPVTSSPSALPTPMPITSSPTVAPTFMPVTATPTMMPTLMPVTSSPSSMPSPQLITASPTLAPVTSAPSQTPTLMPVTSAPSSTPTRMPSNVPSATLATSTPTLTASAAPSNSAPVSSSPSEMPSTDAPSSVPSHKPSGLLPTTAEPSSLPSVYPSDFPSLRPTASPSTTLSSNPSDTPSSSPSKMPSSEPSSFPSSNPSGMPTASFEKATIDGLGLSLLGITDTMLSEDTKNTLSSLMEAHAENYFMSDPDNRIEDFTTTITIVSRRRKLRGGVRNLQDTDIFTIMYDQVVQYRLQDGVDPADATPRFIVTAPLASDAERTALANSIREAGDAVLADVISITEIIFPSTPNPTSDPTMGPITPSNVPSVAPVATPTQQPVVVPEAQDGGDDGISTGAVVGISLAGVFVALLAVYLCYLCKLGRGDDAEATSGREPPPPSELKVKNKADEVSALGGHGGVTTAQPSGDSVAEYGDQSVATVDYDYSKAYGGGGDTSVSSAGGTFGSNTQGLSTLEAANAAATGAALGGAGSFSDTDSFEAHYRDNNANVKEQFIDIYAPAGKLGVVIDTPDDGAPVVHAVKDSSVIGDKILVGDKLVAVDDEDVRSMTAIKVSKLISRKSANPSRKLSLIRTTVA